MWFGIAIAAASAVTSAYAAESEIRQRKAQMDAMNVGMLGSTTGINDIYMNALKDQRKMAAASPSKCPGCGSHEFRIIDTSRICSYCRVQS